MTIKYLGLKVITLTDDFPISYFLIRKNSEIYLDTIKKYKNKTSSEINKMNSSKNIIPFMVIPINFNNSLFFFFIALYFLKILIKAKHITIIKKTIKILFLSHLKKMKVIKMKLMRKRIIKILIIMNIFYQ